jgi:hypothetical protein
VDQIPEPTAPRPIRDTAPILEDSDPIVRVPVVRLLPSLPYYGDQQRWESHADGCSDCSGCGTWPCEVGGPLAVASGDAIVGMRDAARWN